MLYTMYSLSTGNTEFVGNAEFVEIDDNASVVVYFLRMHAKMVSNLLLHSMLSVCLGAVD